MASSQPEKDSCLVDHNNLLDPKNIRLSYLDGNLELIQAAITAGYSYRVR